MKRKHHQAAWTPFVEMNTLINNGVEMAVPDWHMVLTNSRYQVMMRLVPDAEPFGRVALRAAAREGDGARSPATH